MAVERGAIPQGELEQVRRHFRDPAGDVHVGPGWRGSVCACHRAVVAEFAGYEPLAGKQKYASPAFQAFSRPWKRGGKRTAAEYARLGAPIEVFERRGAGGAPRESRRIQLVLCDPCASSVAEDGDVLGAGRVSGR
ncbi:hypothetical protein P3L51_07310 [Streptomyces sp. PSRA5]|uniref:hypothetical protein n=1 Tax=Streptomyces panacea TaxID=3035064 RepID=UPI00339CFD64